MRTITLLRGEHAVVCDCHYDLVKGLRWYLTSWGYVRATHNGKVVIMHRLVNGTPEGLFTDHKNRNRLDNRCFNLQTATYSQNNTNKAVKASSGFTGVYWDKEASKWRASVYKDRKTIFVGLFPTKEEAAIAREQKRFELFAGFKLGEYA